MSLWAAFPKSEMVPSSDMSSFVLLFLTAIPVGIFAVIIGASQFLSIPIFQLFFPQMSLGGIIANLRIGNMVRDVVALLPVRKDIRWKSIGSLLVAACLGSILGTMVIVDVPQSLLLPVLIGAVIVTEAAPWISRRVHRNTLLPAFFLNGAYYGIIGAGGSVISMALLRVRWPRDDELHFVRVHMLVIEAMAFLVSIIAFLSSGQIDWPISLTWGAGAIAGGYIGGKMLRWIGKTSPATQKFWIRLVMVMAVAMASYRAFF